jgi:hypothetical protein
MRRDWRLARRDLLKSLGLGAAGLPLLRAGHAAGASPAGAKHLVCVVQTGGYIQSAWKPPLGPLLTEHLPSSLTPLAPFLDRLIVLPDMTDQSLAGCTTCGTGAYGTILYGLPAVADAAAAPEPTGPTVDQVVASALASSGHRSLPLGVMLDQTVAPPAANRCCWLGPGLPIVPVSDPVVLYKELFSGTPLSADAVKRLLYEKKSVLDYVGRSLEQFKSLVGTADRNAIDQHLDALRNFEQQLQAVRDPKACDASSAIAPVTNDPASYEAVLAAQLSLTTMILRCGISPVVTLQLTDATGSNANLAFAGIGSNSAGARSWRDLAQDQTPDGVALKQTLDEWCMNRFATLLAQLKATPADTRTLLDSTVVLWANHMDDGRSRNPQKIPWMLAGNVGGFFRTQQCAASAGKPTSGVLAEICNAFGMTKHPFGAAMDGLRA